MKLPTRATVRRANRTATKVAVVGLTVIPFVLTPLAIETNVANASPVFTVRAFAGFLLAATLLGLGVAAVTALAQRTFRHAPHAFVGGYFGLGWLCTVGIDTLSPYSVVIDVLMAVTAVVTITGYVLRAMGDGPVPLRRRKAADAS